MVQPFVCMPLFVYRTKNDLTWEINTIHREDHNENQSHVLMHSEPYWLLMKQQLRSPQKVPAKSKQRSQEGNMSNVSRRSFFKTAGALSGVALMGGMVGCTPQDSKALAEAETPTATADAPTQEATTTNPFAAPEAIDEAAVTKTEEADLVIVGIGTAGLTCAVKAAQGGATVIMIAKDSEPSSQGGSNFAINSRLTKELGAEIDVETALRHSMQTQGYQVSEGQWAIFARESGRSMDWLMDLVEPYGIGATLEMPENAGAGALLGEYPGSHVFFGGPKDQPFGDQPDVLDALVDILVNELGQTTYFNTTAKQLVRDDGGKGRVSAVIAQDANGDYVKYVGNKAVVLATGDYANNPDMVEKWCPLAKGMPSMKMPMNNTGDGHLMAMWAGAAMQRCQSHGAMIFGALNYRNLAVNTHGERFMSERANNGYGGIQALMQDDRCYYQLWDSDFGNEWLDSPARYNSEPTTHEAMIASFEAGAESGELMRADTLEELASLMDVPVDALKATVNRYNELCKKGVDEDFFKASDILFAVEKAPFYARRVEANLLITLGGLDVTDQMEVRDEKGNIIEGLYALGSVAGNFFGGPYTTYFAGLNMGRSVCFGHLIGERLSQM